MKKFILTFFLILSTLFIFTNNYFIFADKSQNGLENLITENEITYQIYDVNKNLIFEKQNVEIGDIFIDKNFFVYEIILINKQEQTAVAKLIKKISKPKIEKNISKNTVSSTGNKNIAIYMTHNDESYINGDGTESIYGKGGVHDIAKQLSKCLEDLGVKTTIDETLHIPHNSSAYTRSAKTATNLLKSNPDAIFDIHRDGASRSSYVKKVEGIEKCQIMIVVGQANPNKEQNLEFALYLMAVAEETYPWLFKDIYFAKGHYNQSLKNKALLFECGSNNVEKNLVEKSIPYLAKTITTTLYNTTINDNGDLKINSSLNNDTETTINNYLEKENVSYNNYGKILVTIIILSGIVYICYILYKRIHLDKNFKI